MPSIVIGKQCRFCGNLISDSISNQLGSEAAGFMCLECLVAERASLNQLSRELSEASTTNVEVPGDPSPCAMCGTTAPDEYRLVHIDGRMGFICLACEPQWARLNRDRIGPIAQFALKLK